MGVRKQDVATGVAVVVMGVCGVGKSLLAGRLSQALKVGMVEADEFHNAENRRKMAAGIALGETDRLPWLDSGSRAARCRMESSGSAIVACSALRRTCRDRLRADLPSCVFVHLAGPKALIEDRLNRRQDHFAGIALLTMPIFVPIIKSLGYDPVWFGVLFCMNMQVSFLSPLFGPVAFYLKSVAPKDITLATIFRSLLPFIAMQILAVAILIVAPWITGR